MDFIGDRNDVEKTVPIEFSADEALVLFELLWRTTEENDSIPTEHQAEKQLLWNLLATLETVLVEPFKSNYDELLDSARKKVAGEGVDESPSSEG